MLFKLQLKIFNNHPIFRMPAFKVKVKWGKETFKDVEVNTDEEVLLFKATLFSLSGVNPERQKICKYYLFHN